MSIFCSMEVFAEKQGGILRTTHRGNPPSLSIHQEATIDTVFPMMAVYNNLVLYDPFKKIESMDTIIPELAESWAWSDDGKKLTFRLRRGVRWHDGKAFSSLDVKDTFDIVRGASSKRMKLNPRKLWYFNIENITTNGDYEVTFHLKRPQPSLLAMLASGYSPVHPAHIAPNELRTKAVGTGPFKLVKFERDQRIVLERNKDYFIKGRPYLDGIVITIIRSQSTRHAALVANQVDVSYPYDINHNAYQTMKSQAPNLVFVETTSNVSDNLIVNTKKPPFNNPKIRLAASLAIDRDAVNKSIFQGRAFKGGAMLPPPWGVWGIAEKDLKDVPGYGDAEKNREEARKIMKELGYGPSNPLKVKLSTRAISDYVNTAVLVAAHLKEVYFDAPLEQVETGNWHAKVAKRDYQIALNLTGVGIDDPDANFYENYTCGSQRNYSDYCNPELEKLFDKQSAERDFQKRLKLVHQIDLQLQKDGARPMLAHRTGYTVFYPYVKNLIPHQNLYNPWRMQEVWLDK
ncbi:MAG: peptide ABC transporter substrate-binding protein [Proteobacteria bacterium]|nr:peptide ABC transporter substrate-binding protein [Pseudomonadota bacterium]